MGRHQRPAVRDRRVPRHQLNGRHGQALAEGVLGGGQVARGVGVARIPDRAAHLAGDVDPRRLAEAEATKRLVEPFPTQLEPDPGRSVVVRQLEHLLRRDRSMTPRMVVAVRVLDPHPCDGQVVVVDHLGRGRDGAGVERRRDREGLHHRPRFVRMRHRRVVVQGRVRGPVEVGVVAREGGHAQDRARVDVHHDAGGALRVVARVAVVELRLEDVLHP